jgi:hypothetical protein
LTADVNRFAIRRFVFSVFHNTTATDDSRVIVEHDDFEVGYLPRVGAEGAGLNIFYVLRFASDTPVGINKNRIIGFDSLNSRCIFLFDCARPIVFNAHQLCFDCRRIHGLFSGIGVSRRGTICICLLTTAQDH